MLFLNLSRITRDRCPSATWPTPWPRLTPTTCSPRPTTTTMITTNGRWLVNSFSSIQVLRTYIRYKFKWRFPTFRVRSSVYLCIHKCPINFKHGLMISITVRRCSSSVIYNNKNTIRLFRK